MNIPRAPEPNWGQYCATKKRYEDPNYQRSRINVPRYGKEFNNWWVGYLHPRAQAVLIALEKAKPYIRSEIDWYELETQLLANGAQGAYSWNRITDSRFQQGDGERCLEAYVLDNSKPSPAPARSTTTCVLGLRLEKEDKQDNACTDCGFVHHPCWNMDGPSCLPICAICGGGHKFRACWWVNALGTFDG